MLKHKALKILAVVAIFFSVIIYLSLDLIRKNYVVPIITYHAVRPEAPRGAMLVVSARSFDRQMRFLKERHYNVVSLEEIAKVIKEKKRIPPKTIAITIDDGYKDNYTYAYPILEKYNLPATVFLIANEVGNKVGLGDKLTWEEVLLMQDSGLITFGSHTLSHHTLVDIKSEGELRREIFDSKVMLEEKLKRPVNTFCYPVGAFNAKVKNLVKEAGYKVGVAVSPGRAFPNDDVFALKRLRISSNCDNLFVFWIETSGYYTFFKKKRNGY